MDIERALIEDLTTAEPGEKRSAASPECGPLVLCLYSCLHETRTHSPLAAGHLLSALRHLGAKAACEEAAIRGGAQSPSVLASYLEFLLPEVGYQSRPAAPLIRDAIKALRALPGRSSVRLH